MSVQSTHYTATADGPSPHCYEERECGEFAETIVEDTDEFRTTRIDVKDGPEIVQIERK